MKQIKCKDLIQSEFNKTIRNLKDEIDKSLFSEFALSYDYVDYEGDGKGFIQYQLSWGGPSDEFRIYLNKNYEPDHIEYWYMDWYDSAKIDLKKDSDEWNLLIHVFNYYGGSKYAQEMIKAYHD